MNENPENHQFVSFLLEDLYEDATSEIEDVDRVIVAVTNVPVALDAEKIGFHSKIDCLDGFVLGIDFAAPRCHFDLRFGMSFESGYSYHHLAHQAAQESLQSRWRTPNANQP